MEGTWRIAFAFSKIAVTDTFAGAPRATLGRSVTVGLRLNDWNKTFIRHDLKGAKNYHS